jgi:hypothetical protein
MLKTWIAHPTPSPCFDLAWFSGLGPTGGGVASTWYRFRLDFAGTDLVSLGFQGSESTSVLEESKELGTIELVEYHVEKGAGILENLCFVSMLRFAFSSCGLPELSIFKFNRDYILDDASYNHV